MQLCPAITAHPRGLPEAAAGALGVAGVVRVLTAPPADDVALPVPLSV